MTSFSRRLNRLLDEAFQAPQWTREDGGSITSAWLPAVDVFEEGEKRQTAEEHTERVHRYERCYGAFERSFTVPTSIDADHIKAAYEDGVLTLTLPKVERAKPRQITVEVRKK